MSEDEERNEHFIDRVLDSLPADGLEPPRHKIPSTIVDELQVGLLRENHDLTFAMNVLEGGPYPLPDKPVRAIKSFKTFLKEFDRAYEKTLLSMTPEGRNNMVPHGLLLRMDSQSCPLGCHKHIKRSPPGCRESIKPGCRQHISGRGELLYESSSLSEYECD